MAGNPYFNDPTIANAAASIAGLFAPPSAQEQAAYAAMAKSEAERKAAEQDYAVIAQQLGPEMAAMFRMGGPGVLSSFPDYDLYRRAAALPPGADMAQLDPYAYGATGTAAGTMGNLSADRAAATRRAEIAAAAEIEKQILSNQGAQTRQDTQSLTVAPGATVYPSTTARAAGGFPAMLAGTMNVGAGSTGFMPDGQMLPGAPTVDTTRAGAMTDMLGSSDMTDAATWAMIMNESDPVTIGGSPMAPGDIYDTGGNRLGPAPLVTSETGVKGELLGQASPSVQASAITPALVPVGGAPGVAPTLRLPADAVNQPGELKPLSSDEALAQFMLDPTNPNSADLLNDFYVSKLGTQDIQTPAGPRIVSTPNAIDQPPALGPASDTVSNYKLPDGSVVIGRVGADGVVVNAQTGERLPPDAMKFGVQATGTEAGVESTTSYRSTLERDLYNIDNVVMTGHKLRDLVSANPGSQGVAGFIRGTAQDLLQTGSELGAALGGDVQAAINEAISDQDFVAAGGYDPTIPAIDFLANVLAFQYAKMLNPDRFSNEQYRAARAALGEGLLANQASTIERVDQMLSEMADRRQMIETKLTTGPLTGAPVGGAAPAAAAPAAAAPAAPHPSEVPVGGTWTDPDSGTTFRRKDGGAWNEVGGWEPVQ